MGEKQMELLVFLGNYVIMIGLVRSFMAPWTKKSLTPLWFLYQTSISGLGLTYQFATKKKRKKRTTNPFRIDAINIILLAIALDSIREISATTNLILSIPSIFRFLSLYLSLPLFFRRVNILASETHTHKKKNQYTKKYRRRDAKRQTCTYLRHNTALYMETPLFFGKVMQNVSLFFIFLFLLPL